MVCDTMTSAERMAAVIKGEKPDRVPVIPFIFGHCALVSGMPLAAVFDDADKSFKCQMLTAELYGYDGTPLYGYASAGAWEMGGEIEMPYKKYSGAPVVTRHPVQTEQDVYDLKVPEDITRAGAFPIALRMARLQAEYGMPITMQTGSVFTWAGSVIGEQRMLTWMIRKPEIVHIVLEKVTQFIFRVVEHYVSEFGPEHIMAFFGSPTESNKLISPRQFEAFALPYTIRVNERVAELGVPMVFAHLCGEQNKNLPMWQTVPFGKRAILSFGREVNLAKAMEMFPDKIIAGNVDPTLIQEGKPEEVLEQSKECIDIAKYHSGGFVLMSGCDVPPQAPPVNVFQMVKASREFGRY